MILTLQLVDINGHPFAAHAIGATDAGELVSQIGPTLVQPDGWLIPAGAPRSHRQCCQWGLSLQTVIGTVLQIAARADVFVAADLPETDRRVTRWLALSKLHDGRLTAWIRPGPERVSLAGEFAGARELLDAFFVLKTKGMVA